MEIGAFDSLVEFVSTDTDYRAGSVLVAFRSERWAQLRPPLVGRFSCNDFVQCAYLGWEVYDLINDVLVPLRTADHARQVELVLVCRD